MLVEGSVRVVRGPAEPAGHLLHDRLNTDLRDGNQTAVIDVIIMRMARCHDELKKTGDKQNGQSEERRRRYKQEPVPATVRGTSAAVSSTARA